MGGGEEGIQPLFQVKVSFWTKPYGIALQPSSAEVSQTRRLFENTMTIQMQN